MTTGERGHRLAPWLHALIVGGGGAAVVQVVQDVLPRHDWWEVAALALFLVSRVVGLALAHAPPRPQSRPLGVRNIAGLKREATRIAEELHVLTNKVTALVAEIDLAVESEERL